MKTKDKDEMRDRSLKIVKDYNMYKRAIWQCSFPPEGSEAKAKASGIEVPRKEYVVDLNLLFGLLEEININLSINDIKKTTGLHEKRITQRFSIIMPKNIYESLL